MTLIRTDLAGYTQCHFFAGIGGWAYAIDLAGWPRDRPVWTGSCPCQPFSSAGARNGFADERHLWPAWFHLIRECRPNVVFGEQVASAIRHGWLDLVSADMEAEGYAIGASVLGAHSVGAPHIRQRLYWVADSKSQRKDPITEGSPNGLFQSEGCSGDDGRMADSMQPGWAERRAGARDGQIAGGGSMGRPSGAGSLSSAFLGVCPSQESAGARNFESQRHCGGMGDTCQQGPQGHWRPVAVNDEAGREDARRHGSASGIWAGEWRVGADGKARLIEPGIEPLAHGLSARVVRLRAYGNAIVPQTAAAFIAAFMAEEKAAASIAA